MSALTSPRGPLPARVYWVRRLVLLSIVFLLVFGVSRLVPGGDDAEGTDQSARTVGTTTGAEDADTDGDASEETSEPDGTEDPDASGGTGPDGEETQEKRRKKKTRKPEPPPLPEPDGPCDPADITVTPVVPDRITSKGLAIALGFQAEEAEACTWTVSADTVTAKITSGADDIWSSQQCPAAVPEREIVVYSSETTEVPLVWNLRRSDEECSRHTQWARLGWYHVATAAYGGEPTSVQFQLARSPEKVVGKKNKKNADTKKRKDKAKKKNRTRQGGDRRQDRDGRSSDNNRGNGEGTGGNNREHRSGDSGAGTAEPNG